MTMLEKLLQLRGDPRPLKDVPLSELAALLDEAKDAIGLVSSALLERFDGKEWKPWEHEAYEHLRYAKTDVYDAVCQLNTGVDLTEGRRQRESGNA